ncbi:hypothetical protein CEP51_009456 [Fusarium floridanum]|uniref:DUF6603 domain-containing protein n=1 Tax=Fusarium floridanum TaxID=1325733 RepID=A0A428RHL7_9HYPO|nr:hypothetical protein CEP51_009456 [Fusarium floridanum]
MEFQSKVSVESFHINVGLGDCAIHVLAKRETTTGKLYAESAVLIDGGLGNDAASQNIDDTIEAIETRFENLDSNKNLLRFRSVVVTHWDADHWEGIDRLLKRGSELLDKKKRYRRFYYDSEGTTTVYAPDVPTSKGSIKFEARMEENTYNFLFNGKHLADARVGSDIIGYDFFTNKKPSHLEFKKITGLEKLLGNNPPEVGMYCVASNFNIVGGVIRKWQPGEDEFLIFQMPTKTNQASIATIIVWKNKHISHYSAGDLDYKGENAILEWLKPNLKDNGTPFNITCIKSSHHGARNSNPPTLFRQAKPKHIILSVANHYGHPAWETLLVLYDYYLRQRRANGKTKIRGPCILTCYPYWLANIFTMDGLEPNKINVDPFLSDAALKNLSAARQRNAKHLKQFFKGLEDMEDSKQNLFEEILQLCKENKAKTQTEIFEQITIAMCLPALGLILDVWEWNNSGYITDELVYACLTLVDVAGRDGEVRYSKKDKESNMGKLVEQVFINTDKSDKIEKLSKERKEKKETPTNKRVWVCQDGKSFKPFLQTSSRSLKEKNEEILDWEKPQKKPKPGMKMTSHLSDGLFLMSVPENTSPPAEDCHCGILSSSYDASEVARDMSADYTILDVKDWLDDFLLTMRPSVIQLEPSHDNGWASFHKDYFLGQWIRAGLGGSEMAANRQEREFRIMTPHGHVFSTRAAADALSASGVVSTDGLSEWTMKQTMALGLDPTTSRLKTALSIGEILAMFPTDVSTPDRATQLMTIVNDNLLGLKWNLNLGASKGSRNAIWITPASNYRTILRLEYIPEQESKKAICEFLGNFFPSADKDDEPVFGVSDVRLIYRKVCTIKLREGRQTTLASIQSLTLSAVVELRGPKPTDPKKERASVSPTVSIELASTGSLELTIKTTNSKDNFTAVVSGWLSKLFPGSDTTFGTLAEQGLSQDIWFRRLTLTLAPDKSISGASVALEVNAKLGRDPEATTNLPILFEAKYENKPGGESDWSISGKLWRRTNEDIPRALFGDYEEYRNLEPVTQNPAKFLEITTLFASMTNAQQIPDLPAGIPNIITRAGFRVNKNSIFVSGTIADCHHTLDGSKVPPLRFQQLSVEARWNWTQKLIEVDLSFWLSLTLPPWWDAPDDCPGNAIIGSVSYKSGGKWSISAAIVDLNLGMLYDFFPKSVQDTLFQMLKGIRVVDLSIVYQSSGPEKGTDLRCSGNLMLGDVVSLGLVYEYDADGAWKFHAGLGPAHDLIEPVTLGQIIDSLVDPSDTSLSSSLPDFLADTIILGGPDSDPKLELTVENHETTGPKLKVTASIAGFQVEFVQIGDAQEAKAGENGELAHPSKKPGKILRLFKAVLTKIPMPKDIPIIGHMDQPFDELGFFWINQTVSTEQLAALDSNLQMPSPPPTPDSEHGSSAAGGKKTGESGTGMTGGFHFVIIRKGKVVMDYPIGKARLDERKPRDTDHSPPDDQPAKEPEPGDVKPAEPLKPGADKTDKKSQSSKSTYKNTMGPLNITQIGFRYEGGSLAILMDATIALGPLVVDLMGFTLGLHFKASKGLQSLSWHDVEVSISGLSVMFERPPLTIAGGFLHEKTADSDMYAGGLTVGFTPWLFQAAGFYGVIGKPEDPDRFKCLFAYAMLRGPIMNIAGFAEISGLTGAFGYNVDLTLPTLDNVTRFPLLTPSEKASPPSKLIRTLIPAAGQRGPFFNPLNGAMFVAAGLTVTAFQMLEMTAVIAVQWSPRVQLALLGLAKCDVPSIKSPVKFAHIELGVIATIDLDAGLMKLEAQLSPNSWIIHESCHLTGGFAVYYWFGAGQSDWVMTMGGYHSAFIVPAHYPRPDRLRINWSIDSSLSVTGEAYFAITPKVCMGGLRIRASLSLGSLYAWFDASADFLMTYAPFHFIADVKVSVGVRYSMDVWFVTVNISVEIAASLSLMGPPLRGIVHVDFWVFGFDIAFGDPDGAAVPPPVTFEHFWNLVTQAESKSATANKTGNKDAHMFSCTKGLMTEKNEHPKATDPWLVRSGVFQFTVECQFAIQSVTVNGDQASSPEGTAIDKIYAKPMRLTKPITSTLSVVINGPGGSETKGWKAKSAWKHVPQALWGMYKETEDPNVAGAGSDFSNLLSSGDNMACLLMGVVIEPPTPQVSLDKLSAFRVDDAMKKNIFEKGNEPQFPQVESDSESFMPMVRDKKANHWEALQTAWDASPTPQSSVNMWQDVFGTTGLSDKKPKHLIKNTGRLFLSAPYLGNNL